ncbi:hypothetical protein LWC33_29210 [Pseudonocardia sp. RS11V-5]|uniref:hypothetical protein n=1 Tax=Pseudonocardia terrae TaxID=2905831 RepID=UPI001E29958A|nr:hypothetical protein [Pseudonocardia terrae]MCE3555512.1 hypothetical protein [Pseudonocardia terrae]
MPALITIAAAALTAALAVGPTVTANEGRPSEGATSTCTQSRSKTDSDGGWQPTPEQLQRAAELIQQARELVTALSGISDGAQAAALDQVLRSSGITPAIASGWRQTRARHLRRPAPQHGHTGEWASYRARQGRLWSDSRRPAEGSGRSRNAGSEAGRA